MVQNTKNQAKNFYTTLYWVNTMAAVCWRRQAISNHAIGHTGRTGPCLPMMTSSNGNIFRVTGPLCGEFTGHRWICLTKASDAELWCFLWSAPWVNGWVNNRGTGDLSRHRAHYDVIVMHGEIFQFTRASQYQKMIKKNRIYIIMSLQNYSALMGWRLNHYSHVASHLTTWTIIQWKIDHWVWSAMSYS